MPFYMKFVQNKKKLHTQQVMSQVTFSYHMQYGNVQTEGKCN